MEIKKNASASGKTLLEWKVSGRTKHQKVVRKRLIHAAKAFEESKKANKPIVGFRPIYSPLR